MCLKFADELGCFSQQVFHYQWNYQKFKSEFLWYFSHSRLTHLSTDNTKMGKKYDLHFIGPAKRKQENNSAFPWHTSERFLHYCQNFHDLGSAALEKHWQLQDLT